MLKGKIGREGFKFMIIEILGEINVRGWENIRKKEIEGGVIIFEKKKVLEIERKKKGENKKRKKIKRKEIKKVRKKKNRIKDFLIEEEKGLRKIDKKKMRIEKKKCWKIRLKIEN